MTEGMAPGPSKGRRTSNACQGASLEIRGYPPTPYFASLKKEGEKSPQYPAGGGRGEEERPFLQTVKGQNHSRTGISENAEPSLGKTYLGKRGRLKKKR